MTAGWSRAGCVALAAAMAIAGCAPVGPNYRRPEVALPANFNAPVTNLAGAPSVPAEWWTLYTDPTLNELVTAALRDNVDLERAAAQVEEAEATLSEVGASLLPEVDLTGSAVRSKSSTVSAQPIPPGVPVISNVARLALSTSFEIDFWGKLRRASEVARAQLIGTRYARDVIAVTLAATTAQTYFTVRSLDAQIAVTRSILGTRDEALTLARNRARGGVASDLDVSQAEGARADIAIQLSELERQRGVLVHQLGALTGRLDLTLPTGDFGALPLVAVPPPGLPSSLIERRPDVRQAEEAVVAANAAIGVARAAQLPTFSLTGNLGVQSASLANIVRSGAQVWSIGPTLLFPVLDAGKYAARTREAEARHRQAVATYRKTVETAYREVSDALVNLELARAAAPDLMVKAEAARNQLRLSRLRYDAGYAPFLEVLDAQRTQNSAELALLQNRQAQLGYSVELMRALGGGWSERQAPSVSTADVAR